MTIAVDWDVKQQIKPKLKVKLNPEDTSFVDIQVIFSHKTERLALSSKRLCDPSDGTSQIL